MYKIIATCIQRTTAFRANNTRSIKGDCLFTQSHADHMIGQQDERSSMKAKLFCVGRLRKAEAACSP